MATSYLEYAEAPQIGIAFMPLVTFIDTRVAGFLQASAFNIVALGCSNDFRTE